MLVRERSLSLPELAANLLVDAEEERVVFDVELRAIVVAEGLLVGADTVFFVALVGLAGVVREPGVVLLALRLGPLGERLDDEPVKAERREHLADVRAKSGAPHDDEHLVSAEAVLVLVREVRETMNADGGLAAASAALNHD